MRIHNQSSYGARLFYPILDFVQSFTKYHNLATLYIRDSDDVFSYGMTHRINPELSDLNFAAPSLVELWVRKEDNTYPITSQASLGPVTVYSWEEEVLLVLAHEMAHVDQWFGYPVHFPKDMEKEAEECAERFAIDTLNYWRNRK